EGLSRHFDNRRQVAAYAGLAPTPWQSGIVDHEQGVSKSGNPRLRSMLIELSWLWVRHQPQSALTIWFKERVKQNGGRFKKSTIVALARKFSRPLSACDGKSSGRLLSMVTKGSKGGSHWGVRNKLWKLRSERLAHRQTEATAVTTGL